METSLFPPVGFLPPGSGWVLLLASFLVGSQTIGLEGCVLGNRVEPLWFWVLGSECKKKLGPEHLQPGRTNLATPHTWAHLAVIMTCGISTTISPTLQLRKLGLREMKSFVQGHTVDLRLKTKSYELLGWNTFLSPE